MRITGDRHVNAPAWYPLFNNQLLFPLTSRVEATGRRTIPKAKKTKKRRTQFRARLPRPCMGRRALPAVSHGPEATVYQEPKNEPGGVSGRDYAPALSFPILQLSTPEASLKRRTRRGRRSGLPFPAGLSPSPLTSVPRDLSMIPKSISSTVTRCRKPYCPRRSPRVCSLVTAPALWTNRTVGNRKSRFRARPRPASTKEGLGSPGGYGSCSFSLG